MSFALLSASDLVRRVRRGDVSAVDVVEACLAQIERHNGEINAVVTINEQALDDARRLDRKRVKGLLHGVPVGIKDVTPVAGLRTTYGSPVYAEHVPEADALVVRRLREAGAVILGKTNTPEFATGGNTFNAVFGRTRNPWDPSRSAGGSTGGGAAGLATGMIALAEGTDLGGSLRIPASFCGVVGLRPSPGLVPTAPSDYLWDAMQVTGGMGRTAEDVALFLQATAGPSPDCPVYQPTEGRDFVGAVREGLPRGLRAAYCPDVAGIGIDDGIEAVCRSAAFELAQAGVAVEEIALDLTEAREAFLALRGYWMVAQHHHRLGLVGRFGDNLAGNIRAGLDTPADAFGRAEQARSRLWRRFRDFFDDFDVLLTPCMAVPPFPVEQNYPETIGGRPMATYIDWVAPTFVLSLTGLPVASVPCGLDGEGLPVGLQIAGPMLGEERALAVAAAVQAARPIGLPVDAA
ncbi:MAG: amidase family protein [Rhodothermales bacterium]|nr:amidase family protein [Rhodothermales bacterium]